VCNGGVGSSGHFTSSGDDEQLVRERLEQRRRFGLVGRIELLRRIDLQLGSERRRHTLQ
jgi:hypothetical protein